MAAALLALVPVAYATGPRRVMSRQEAEAMQAYEQAKHRYNQLARQWRLTGKPSNLVPGMRAARAEVKRAQQRWIDATKVTSDMVRRRYGPRQRVLPGGRRLKGNR